MERTRETNGVSEARAIDGAPDGTPGVDPATPDTLGASGSLDDSEQRIGELEVRLAEREAQLAEAERAIAEAAGDLGRRRRRKVLEGRADLAAAHERVERELARSMGIERELDRQAGLRHEEREKADRRVAHLKEQKERELADARARADREAAELRDALGRARSEAEVDARRAQSSLEERGRRLEVDLNDARAAVEEARSRLDREHALRRKAEDRLATARESQAAGPGEAHRRRPDG